MPKGVFDEETKLLQKFKKRDVTFHEDYKKWREYWKEEGPVKFAYQILKFDPNTGGPLKLSEGQEEFLIDVGMKGIRLAIITAGRGSGKTFVLAVYIMWRIYTQDNYTIASMGGSQEQSDKIASYIQGWIRGNSVLENYTLKNIQRETLTYSGGQATFHACSGTSVRGPHTNDVIIDEQASGEEKGGQRHIRAATWDVSTSPDIHIIQSSTAHYIHGDFLQTWNNAEKLGYKRYQWSIAKHVNGEIDPYKIYEDTNPKHWLSNVPWIPDINIQILRNKEANDKWLVEALGGISMSSGLVFNPADFNACICKGNCDICEAYKDGICLETIHKVLWMEGVSLEEMPKSTIEALNKYVHNRVLGIDYGRGAPTAFVVLGQFKDWIFVLEAHETLGLTDQEKVQMAVDLCKKWEIEVVRPDPQESVLNNMIADLVDASIHFDIWSGGSEGGSKKYSFVAALKKYVERHKLVIPREEMFDDLIRSLRNLTWDDKGKIRKQDDHSADAIMYAISYYDEFDNDSSLWDVTSGGFGKGELPPDDSAKQFWKESKKLAKEDEEFRGLLW